MVLLVCVSSARTVKSGRTTRLAAIREDRETLVPEAMEALKILNSLHWHGWNHASKFKAWAEEFELPSSVEESKAQGWNGDEWMAKLVGIVKTPTRRLDAPFVRLECGSHRVRWSGR